MAASLATTRAPRPTSMPPGRIMATATQPLAPPHLATLDRLTTRTRTLARPPLDLGMVLPLLPVLLGVMHLCPSALPPPRACLTRRP